MIEVLALDQWKLAESTSANIPNGYHITELGVLPTDWRVRLLPEVCRFRGGKAHEQFISSSGAYACVNSKFISSDAKIVKFSSENHCAAKIGDILMVMSDLPNGKALAKAFVADRDNFYAVNQRVCALTPYRDSSRYLYYALNRHPYFLKFDDGVNQTHLLNPVFKKCPVALPPTAQEQQAIAEALSDADALIEGLEKLIAKKRLIKQGAMQELLTGKRRLPGFSGDWITIPLGELGRWQGGATPSMRRPEFWDRGSIPWVSSADVRIGTISTTNFITERGLKESSTNLVPASSILIVTRSGILRRFLPVALASQPVAINQDIKSLTPTSSFVAAYVFQAISAANDRILSTCMKSGTTVESIELNWLKRFEIGLPLELNEQHAVAALLTDMDREIKSLETKLSKARCIKQGMMQELLTGRIRLV